MSQAVRKPCFSTSIPRGQIPRFPDAGAAGQTLKSRSRPLPTHPGMKYFREETLAVDVTMEILELELAMRSRIEAMPVGAGNVDV